jgi:flagellar biosynthesis component FlhA
MPHNETKERQEASLIGRLFSMEALIFVMGCLSFVYGFTDDKPMNIFWGVVILVGFFVLRRVRKKDWKKHWEELEAEQKAHQQRRDAQRPPEDRGEPKE